MPDGAEPHIVTRARERYGLEMTPDDVRDLARRIGAGKSVRMVRQRDGLEKHAVELRPGTELIVLWEPVEHFIVTILPREAATSRGMNAFRKARARGKNGRPKGRR